MYNSVLLRLQYSGLRNGAKACFANVEPSGPRVFGPRVFQLCLPFGLKYSGQGRATEMLIGRLVELGCFTTGSEYSGFRNLHLSHL
jgi:hypothetical protein